MADGGKDSRVQHLRATVSRPARPQDRGPRLADGCPFQPLGVDGSDVLVLDAVGQVRRCSTDKLGRNTLVSLCAPHTDWLVANYPRPKKGQNSDEADTFRPELVSDALQATCARLGPIDLAESMRGRGASADSSGELVLHLGLKLWVRGKERDTGRRVSETGEAQIFPRLPALPGPTATVEEPGEASIGRELWHEIKCYSWARPDLDAQLLLGFIGVALIGGALDVRPQLFITGTRGSGKSHVLSFLSRTLGGWALSFSDATPAGVYQRLQQDSLAVLLDEFESSDNNERAIAMLNIGLSAYSGGELSRGGQQHKATSFKLRSAFCFAGINIPPMEPAARSRVAVLELQPPVGARPRLVVNADAPRLGRRALTRLCDRWEHLRLKVLPACRENLQRMGFDDRLADTYGTLLACAHVLQSDDDVLAGGLDHLAGDLLGVLKAHKTEEKPEWRRCLDHILDQPVDVFRRGEQRTLGEWLQEAAGYGRTEIVPEFNALPGVKPHQRTEAQAADEAQRSEAAREASSVLARCGLRLWGGEGQRWLFVANQSVRLREFFRGLRWEGLPGGTGGWRQPLLRAPGAKVAATGMRVAGTVTKGVILPLEVVLAGMVGMSHEEAAAAGVVLPGDEP